jgi:hypothetical protein
MDDQFINNFMWNAFSLVLVIFSLYNFMAIFQYKNRKLKEDILIVEKIFVQLLVFSYICFITFTNIMDFETIDHLTKNLILIPYFLLIFFQNILISWEGFKSVRDPSFALRYYIMNNKVWTINYFYEIISLILIGLSVLMVLVLKDSQDYSKFIFSDNLLVFPICLVFSIFSILFSFKKRLNFKQYLVENKKHALIRNTCEILINLLYFFMIFFYLSVSILARLDIISYSTQQNSFINVFSVYIFICVSFFDSILQAYCIYKSDFYFYTLGHTNFGCFYKIFGSNVYKKPILSSDFSTFNANMKETSVLYFHNNLSLMIEEFLIDTFDNLINISLASICLIKDGIVESEKSIIIKSNSKSNIIKNLNFEPESKEDKLLPTEDFSSSDNSSNYLNKKFTFTRKSFNDERLSRLISFNPDKDSVMVNGGDYSNSSLKVHVESLCHQQFTNFLKLREINLKSVKESLLSHVNATTWLSLLNKNSKEDYFRKQNKLLLNTYDRLYSIEFYSDESIFSSELKCRNFIKNYFRHMESNKKSFLPLILGIYKIKIDNFKEMTIVLTKNLIIQEDPREHYNYWQLMRLSGKMEMMTSSKDRHSNLVKDEILFRNGLKLKLGDYRGFEYILQKDLDFFKKMKIKDFALLIMYYEMGCGSRSESAEEIPVQSNRLSTGMMGAIRISVISKGNKNILESKSDETSCIFDPNVIQGGRESNGFEARYNDFKCVMFFVFDNIFQSGATCCSGNIFKKYSSKVMNYFDESGLNISTS